MKTYGVRSSAIRAARKAGLKDGEFEVVQVWQEGGKSSWQYVAKAEATVATEPVAIEGAKTVEATEVPAPAVEVERVRESTIEKPTRAVWTIADEMKAANPNVTRKAIVDECVRRGVAFYTARTQYQLWRKAKAATAAA